MKNSLLPVHLTLKEVQSLPTLHIGHFDDLKIQSGSTRIWLSRMTIEDGQPYNNMVRVERINNRGQWQEVENYEAK